VGVPTAGSFHLGVDGAEVRATVAADASWECVLHGYYGTALPLFAQAAFGYEVLHASAILVDGAAVAFCGWTGLGKTTIASSLSRRGFELWADDAVALSPREVETPVSVFLPFIREGEVASPPAGLEQVPLAAVFLLERVDADDVNGAEVARPSPGEAVGALVSHAYRFSPQPPERRRQMLETYFDVAARVPVFSLRVAHDPDRLPELLDRIESRLRTRIIGRR